MKVGCCMLNYFNVKGKNGLTLNYKPLTCELSVTHNEKVWEFNNDEKPFLNVSIKGEIITIFFTDAKKILLSDYNSGTGEGVRAIYSDFYKNNKPLDFKIDTLVWIDKYKGDLRFEIAVYNDDTGLISHIFWPQHINFNSEDIKAYTVIPMMQGTLIPAKWKNTIVSYGSGRLFGRDAYMPWWGQICDHSGYLCIVETPWDAAYMLEHIPKGDTSIANIWHASLGKMSYRRIVKYTFMTNCDYNDFCKEYRTYVKEKGEFVSLNEKIVRNPSVAKLLGTPIIHTHIYWHIVEESKYYDHKNLENNDSCVTFYEREQQLKVLKERGVDQAYLHLDAWGKRGYDNLHPDVLPPCQIAGGTEGMKHLADTCHEIGYMFGIHDQYRDYYLDAETYNENQAIQNIDGNLPGEATWYGGRQSFLCATLAPYYVKRNYMMFKELDINIEGAYLDVFAVVELDECFHDLHRMTRKECAEKRRETFEYLRSTGIIASSEETVDCIIKSLDLCHHSPYPLSPKLDYGIGNGIPVPLFNLVYHDTIVIPWQGLQRGKGGWGIPNTDWGFLYALLNGGTIYYNIDETDENIELGKLALELHKRVGTLELLKHEFIEGDYRRQRTVFADGTTVEIDLKNDTYKIIYPDV